MAPHHIWLESTSPFEVGKEVKCFIKYGHYLNTDGVPDVERVKAVVYGSSEDGEEVEVKSEGGEIFVSFIPEKKGSYVVSVDYGCKVWSITKDGRYLVGSREENENEEIEQVKYSCQFAKMFIPVEEVTFPSALGQDLEIVPLDVGEDHLEVRVQYEGQPLPEASLIIVSRGGTPKTVSTDSAGKARIPRCGSFQIVVARHSVPNWGDFDEKTITSVLSYQE